MHKHRDKTAAAAHLFALGNTSGVSIYNETGECLGASGARVGLRQHEVPISVTSVLGSKEGVVLVSQARARNFWRAKYSTHSDPHLGSIDDPLVALLLSASGDVGDI